MYCTHVCRAQNAASFEVQETVDYIMAQGWFHNALILMSVYFNIKHASSV